VLCEIDAVAYHGIFHYGNEVLPIFILVTLVYNLTMLESIFQILAVYFFAATPCFAGWIANGGKREDIGVPIVLSVLLSLLFGFLIFLGQ